MYADGQGMGRSMSESVSLWAFVSAENLAAGWISAEEIYAREWEAGFLLEKFMRMSWWVQLSRTAFAFIHCGMSVVQK